MFELPLSRIIENMVKYPEYTQELEHILEIDQAAWKSFWAHNHKRLDTPEFKEEFDRVRKTQQEHATRALEILDTIRLPTIGNLGREAAKAMSIIALHDRLSTLKRVLKAFLDSYELNKDDTYYQAIPSMMDRVRILERKPQVFGTQRDIDKDEMVGTFMPTVEDFEHVNERRAEYGIEPLRWPKSLAIPESEQPWLKRPLSELVMRDVTNEEFEARYREYVD